MAAQRMHVQRTWKSLLAQLSVYVILLVAGVVVLVPFILAFFGSFKTAEDFFTYPPRLLPHVAATADVDGEPLPLFTVPLPDGGTANLVRLENGTSLREFIGVDDPSVVIVAPTDALTATGQTIVVEDHRAVTDSLRAIVGKQLHNRRIADARHRRQCVHRAADQSHRTGDRQRR